MSLDFVEVQNICYGPLTKTIPELISEEAKDEGAAKTALSELGHLREKLRIRDSRSLDATVHYSLRDIPAAV